MLISEFCFTMAIQTVWSDRSHVI